MRPWVNAETMSLFLAEVAQRHASEFVCMVMDQAGWHVAGELTVPPNMRLMFLPPYSPPNSTSSRAPVGDAARSVLRQPRLPGP